MIDSGSMDYSILKTWCSWFELVDERFVERESTTWACIILHEVGVSLRDDS